MDVVILDICKKELKDFPKDVLEDFLDAVAKLKLGLNLSMPLSRPMFSVLSGLHELRFRDRSGIYRVFYIIRKGDAIYAIHAFKKKNQETPLKNLEIVKKRARSIVQ